MLRAAIFDMDGTMIDSEEAITLAGVEALVDWNIQSTPDDFRHFTGMGDEKFIGGVARMYGAEYTPDMKKRAYEIFFEKANERVKVYPWAIPLVEVMQKNHIKTAIASSADFERLYGNIKHVGIDPEQFDAIISARDVTEQKPNPEIIQKAMAKLQVQPFETVVFEDSIMGVRAAKNAGAACIAVTTGSKAEVLYEAGADLVLDDLRDVVRMLQIMFR